MDKIYNCIREQTVREAVKRLELEEYADARKGLPSGRIEFWPDELNTKSIIQTILPLGKGYWVLFDQV